MDEADIEKLAEKIIEINSKELYLMLFLKAGLLCSADEIETGLYKIDVLNALNHMEKESIKEIEQETNRYRAYTKVFLKYGYQLVYARNREEADTDDFDTKIHWSSNLYFLKKAKTRYMHELRILCKGKKHVTHIYDGSYIMNEYEIKNFAKKFLQEAELNSCEVEYSFIKDGVIHFEKTYKL